MKLTKNKTEDDMIGKGRSALLGLLVSCFFLGVVSAAAADDSEPSQRTLTGLQGLYVVIEDFQPNIMKYDKYLLKAGLSKSQLQRDVEARLKTAGIRILSRDEWLKTLGRPVLYVNVNTHENEKFWFAYDIKAELRQVVCLDVRPEIKMLANTWSINMTGLVNIGTFENIRQNVDVVLNKFVLAYQSANKIKPTFHDNSLKHWGAIRWRNS
jgi:hypothetical protein